MWIEFEGLYYAAEPVGYDLLSRLAIIQVQQKPEGMEYLSLASTDPLPPIGTLSLAITRQNELPPSPYLGIISGHDIRFGKHTLPTTHLRANIPAETGELGSPVFDLNGQLTGIIVLALPEVRSSFVLPVKAIRRVRDDIIFSGEVRYARFGLLAAPAMDQNRHRHMVINGIVPGTPASQSGLQAGDILLAIGDFTIEDECDLREAVFFTPPDQMVTVSILREEEKLVFPLKVDHIPPPEPPNEEPIPPAHDESVASPTSPKPIEPEVLDSTQVKQPSATH